MDITVAPGFRSTLDSLKRQLPQSILLHGDFGVGLTTIAKNIAGQTYELVQPVSLRPTSPPSISVEMIRDLYTATRSKRQAQVIIVDDAHTMTLPAQHAFLKLLEEPQPYVRFILVSHLPGKLLPTVHSRLQQYHIPRLPEADFAAYLDAATPDATQRRQVQFVASGRIAQAKRLLEDPKQLEALATLMRDAQVFVGSNRYQACQLIARYGATSRQAVSLVEAGIHILRHTVTHKPSRAVIDQLELLISIHDRLRSNAQPRLQLLSFVVQ